MKTGKSGFFFRALPQKGPFGPTPTPRMVPILYILYILCSIYTIYVYIQCIYTVKQYIHCKNQFFLAIKNRFSLILGSKSMFFLSILGLKIDFRSKNCFFFDFFWKKNLIFFDFWPKKYRFSVFLGLKRPKNSQNWSKMAQKRSKGVKLAQNSSRPSSNCLKILKTHSECFQTYPLTATFHRLKRRFWPF